MNKIKSLIPYLILTIIALTFFYKTLVFGLLPIPGDLLLAEYAPWRQTPYSGYASGAVPNKGQYFDVIRELYPWKQMVVAELKKGKVPLWNPYNFSGSPLLANYQSAVWYPLSLLYFVFSFPIAWSILVIAQVVLSALFTYLFAKRIGIGAWAAGLTAVLYTFSSFATVWIEFNTVWHTWLWLPLLLYLVERFVDQNQIDIVGSCAFVFGLFAALTAGHPQDFLYVFLFLSFYTVFRLHHSKKIKRVGIPLTLLTALTLGLAAVQLAPTIELFRYSSRVPHDPTFIREKMLIQPWQLILLVVQDFFGNPATKSYFLADTYVSKTLSISAAGLLLALVTLIRKKWSWHERFFAVAAGILLLLTVRTPFSSFLYQFPIPILSTGSPTRILGLFMLVLALLAGFGATTLSKEPKKILMPTMLSGGLLGIALLVVTIGTQISLLNLPAGALRTILRGSIIPGITIISVAAVALLGKKYPKLILAIVSLFAVGELFYNFLKFNPFVPAAFVFPENPVLTFLQKKNDLGRFWGYGTARVEANFASQYHLYSADGTDPLNLSWYNQFLQSSVDGNIAQVFTRHTRSDTAIAPGYGERDLPENTARLRVMDALGVTYVLDRVENPRDSTTWSGDRFEQLVDMDGWKIFYNKKAAQRFFLTDKVISYTSTEEFEQRFFDASFDPRNTVLIENADTSLLHLKADPDKKIALVSYEPVKVMFKTHTITPQLLYLSDAWAPGWQGYIDGKKQPIYKVNYAFKGILVPQGNHEVTFVYQPKSFMLGACISQGALVITVGGFVSWCIYQTMHAKKRSR